MKNSFYVLCKSLPFMSHIKCHSYPYLTGALITRLGRDVLMLSGGLSAFCFIGVSAFDFGGLAVSLVFGISTGTDTLSSLPLESPFTVGGVAALPGIGLMWTRSLEYCVPVLSSSTVYDR